MQELKGEKPCRQTLSVGHDLVVTCINSQQLSLLTQDVKKTWPSYNPS